MVSVDNLLIIHNFYFIMDCTIIIMSLSQLLTVGCPPLYFNCFLNESMVECVPNTGFCNGTVECSNFVDEFSFCDGE